MGVILETKPEMGEFSVEVRRESFYLTNYTSDVFMYPQLGARGGTIEFLIADLPKIKAAIKQVEDYLAETGRL